MKRNEIAKLNSAQAATNRFGIGMLTPTLIVLLVMTAYPLIFTFVYSFTDYNYLKGTENASFVLFDNYVSLFKNGYFQQAVWNTIKFTILAVVLEMALGLLIAVFVNSLKRGQKIMRTLLLLPYLLPAVTVALSWRMMLSANYGIINQFLKGLGLPVFNWFMDTKTAFGTILLIDVWQNVPFVFLLLYASLQSVSENQYEEKNGNLLKTTYGNGDWWSYTYDFFDRLTKKTAETGTAAEYVYNSQDQLVRLTDYLSGNTTEYTYDLLGRLTGSRTNGNNDVRAEYSYDKYNRWTGQTNITSGGSHAYGVEYGEDNLVTASNQGRFSFRYGYDNLNRMNVQYLYVDGNSTGHSTRYMYVPGAAGGTTGLVSGIYFLKGLYEDNGNLTYTYDDVGNITTIKENGVLKATYHYDQFGQLVREDNAWMGKTYLYIYDAGGNITQCREALYTTGDVLTYTGGGSTYSYATGTETDGSPVWKDLLTSYNGNTITYDAIGNPLNWGTDISDMHWNNGRRLTYLQKRTNMISYAYDETGLRTEKSTNTNRTYFDRDASGNLVHEFRDYSGYLGEDSHLYYYYDANGSIGSISYNGVRYAFRKNLQGDVIAILDTSGNVVARYTYDAWGRILSITDGNGNANTSSTFIGNVNPIRYRGYYYDTETGWYYLNSRYYDPRWDYRG